MSAFKGPFGSTGNFISHVVLNNCTEFYDVKKNIEQNNNSKTPVKFLLLRRFYNAINSMNHILDCIYWENEAFILNYNNSLNSDRKFINYICGKYPVLDKIRSLSNALKHFKTYSPTKPDIKDISEQTLNIDIDLKTINVNIDFNIGIPQEYEEILNDGFGFWVCFGSNMENFIKGNYTPQETS